MKAFTRIRGSASNAVLGALGALALAPVAGADVLEFKNGEVTTHIAVDYRAVAAEADAEAVLVPVVVTLFTPAPEELRLLIDAAAVAHGVDAALVEAVMAVESNFVVTAVSHKGAQGLMQLMPETAAELGVINAFDPAENIDGGVRYLKRLLGRYNGDRSLALAAYNAGTRAVDSYGGVPPYAETRDYILRINDRLGPPSGTAKASPPAPLVPPATPSLVVYGGQNAVSDGFFDAVMASHVEQSPENPSGDTSGEAVDTAVSSETDVPPAASSAAASEPDTPAVVETPWDDEMEVVFSLPEIPDAAVTRLAD